MVEQRYPEYEKVEREVKEVEKKLSVVYVSVGDKVSSKQSIGSLLADEEGSLSTSHFEIHQVVEGRVQRINPTLWLAQ